ncbi:MAG TPA: hypothetical protein PLJ37_00110 [Chitinophagales bacterium]|nr:hypothetical protein [Chitinophagales bacterium]HMU97799.1 hypothetical protein [Chitinophagales bacterium]HMY41562.1 hypothetical protein [Chitinophagales bacterium]HNB37645.1 hypothetical protein [Chitinophagales bacterium]HNG07574.1 hypothetical protein [Chitinophagales bacterium]
MMINQFKKICLYLFIFLILSCQKPKKALLKDSYENWMQELIEEYPNSDVTLRSIMMPAAHDAGMYDLTKCTFGANFCNTATQSLSFKEQLEQGIRLFDVRPILVGKSYYTQHATDCNGLGCRGASMTDICNDINLFLEDHAELVILELSHFCGITIYDTTFINYLNTILGDKIYKESTIIERPLINRPLKEIIGNSGKGKVLLVFDGILDNFEDKAKGKFPQTIFNKNNSWTNSHYLSDMLKGQLENYRNYQNEENSLFQFSWQITQNEIQAISCALNPQATSIKQGADSANVQIAPVIDSLIKNNQIRKGRIPNVIYLDFSGKFVMEKCLEVSKLNLE